MLIPTRSHTKTINGGRQVIWEMNRAMFSSHISFHGHFGSSHAIWASK